METEKGGVDAMWLRGWGFAQGMGLERTVGRVCMCYGESYGVRRWIRGIWKSDENCVVIVPESMV